MKSQSSHGYSENDRLITPLLKTNKPCAQKLPNLLSVTPKPSPLRHVFSPTEDSSQYQYFINKWKTGCRRASEWPWRREWIDGRRALSAGVCQSWPRIMLLPISPSGPSTSLLLFEWTNPIKSIKTFVHSHTGCRFGPELRTDRGRGSYWLVRLKLYITASRSSAGEGLRAELTHAWTRNMQIRRKVRRCTVSNVHGKNWGHHRMCQMCHKASFRNLIYFLVGM